VFPVTPRLLRLFRIPWLRVSSPESWNIQNEIWNNGSCLVAGWRHGRTHIYAPMRLCTYTDRTHIHAYIYTHICIYIYIYIYKYICKYIMYSSAAPHVHMYAAHAIYTSASRPIFSFLSRTSYVRINPYALLNDIPAYHVGILNATEADSSLGRQTKTQRRPSPPVIRISLSTLCMRNE